MPAGVGTREIPENPFPFFAEESRLGSLCPVDFPLQFPSILPLRAAFARSSALLDPIQKGIVVYVDPHAWIATLPFTLLLVSLWYQPEDNFLKKLWRDIYQIDSEIWSSLGCHELASGSKTMRSIQQAVYWMSIGGLACASLLSFGVFVGVMG